MKTIKAETLTYFDAELAKILVGLDRYEFWNTFTSPDTDNRLKLAMMREVMLEIGRYQQEVNKAVFTSVGKVGKHIDEQGLIRAMIAVQIEEVGHGMLAQQDYVRLGGDPENLKSGLPSVPSTCMISLVRHLAAEYHPLCHLGYMYFFEKFTVLITEAIMPILIDAGYPEDRLSFMALHAQEDVRHADMLANVILECQERYPDSEQHIRYGFDCFAEVYPHRIWQDAFVRAQKSLSHA